MEEAKYEDWKSTVVDSIKKNPEKGALYIPLQELISLYVPYVYRSLCSFQELRKLYRPVSVSQRRMIQKSCKLIHSLS